MAGISEELRYFQTLLPDLVRSHPGEFAVVCGRQLVGVFRSVDAALLATSRAFDGQLLPEGTAILINEIAARSSRASVSVTARAVVAPPPGLRP